MILLFGLVLAIWPTNSQTGGPPYDVDNTRSGVRIGHNEWRMQHTLGTLAGLRAAAFEGKEEGADKDLWRRHRSASGRVARLYGGFASSPFHRLPIVSSIAPMAPAAMAAREEGGKLPAQRIRLFNSPRQQRRYDIPPRSASYAKARGRGSSEAAASSPQSSSSSSSSSSPASTIVADATTRLETTPKAAAAVRGKEQRPPSVSSPSNTPSTSTTRNGRGLAVGDQKSKQPRQRRKSSSVPVGNSERYVRRARDAKEFTSIFKAYGRVRNSTGVLWALELMKMNGIAHNAITYTAAINALAKSDAWRAALNVFEEAARDPRVTLDDRLYSAAIPACRGGAPVINDKKRPADKANEEEEEEEGEGELVAPAVAMLNRMKADGIRADAVAYASTISTCARHNKWWRDGLRVFESAKREGVPLNIVVYNTALHACKTGGQTERARSILEEAKSRGLRPDITSYNSLIATASKSSDERIRAHGVRMLRDMQKLGVDRDIKSFTAAITCCENIEGGWSQALQLLAEMREMKIPRNVRTYTAVLRTLILQAPESMFKLKYDETLTDMEAEDRISPDSAFFSALSGAFMNRGRYLEAAKCVVECRKASLPFPNQLFSQLIDRLIHEEEEREEREEEEEEETHKNQTSSDSTIVTVFKWMINGDIPFSNALQGYINIRREQHREDGGYAAAATAAKRKNAVQKEDGGKDDDINGNIDDDDHNNASMYTERARVLTAQISQYGRQGRWREALNLLKSSYFVSPSSPPSSKGAYREDYGDGHGTQQPSAPSPSSLSPSSSAEPPKEEEAKSMTVAYSAAMSACQKARQWRQTLRLLEEMEEKDIKLDCPAYTLAISALGMRGLRRRAVKMLTKMRRNSVRADNQCYTQAIIAADRVYNGDFAITLLRRMIENQLSPDTITYNAVIKAQARSENRWEYALALVDEMQDRGVQPNEITYNTVISACKRSGNWQGAFSIALSLKNVGIRPSIVTINTVISALETGGKWEAGLALFRSAVDRSITPDHITYTALISSCANNDAWPQALELLYEMHEGMYGVKPRYAAYEALIASCDRNFQFSQAAEVESLAYAAFRKDNSRRTSRYSWRGDMVTTWSYEEEYFDTEEEEEDAAAMHAHAQKQQLQQHRQQQEQQRAAQGPPPAKLRVSFVQNAKWGKFSGKSITSEANEDRSDIRGADNIPPGRPFAYFGVYDGHGGGATSQWLKDNLAATIDRTWDSENVEESIRYAYLRADEEILKPKGGVFGIIGASRGIGGPQCGASAATAILFTDRATGQFQLLTANVGNTVMMVKSKNHQTAVKKSCYHTPDNSTEFDRITALNKNPRMPLIREQGGRLRLGGTLSLTRAFGDAYLKPVYNADEGEEKYASDGTGYFAGGGGSSQKEEGQRFMYDDESIITALSGKKGRGKKGVGRGSTGEHRTAVSSDDNQEQQQQQPQRPITVDDAVAYGQEQQQQQQQQQQQRIGPPLDAPDKIQDFGLMADPDVSVTPLTGDEEWLVVASNGLITQHPGDAGLTMEEISALISEKLPSKSANEVCVELASAARRKGSNDDITIILVPLDKLMSESGQ